MSAENRQCFARLLQTQLGASGESHGNAQAAARGAMAFASRDTQSFIVIQQAGQFNCACIAFGLLIEAACVKNK